MLAGAVAAAVFVLRLRLIAVGRGAPRKAAGINVLRTVETAARYIVHGTGHRIGLPAFSLIAGFAAEGFLFKAPVIKGFATLGFISLMKGLGALPGIGRCALRLKVAYPGLHPVARKFSRSALGKVLR